MSAPTPTPEPSRHPERIAGIFVAVVWASIVFAVDGVLAVVLDRDPIELPVGPFYGVLALGIAMLAVYLGIVFTVPAPRPWLGAVATAAAVYLVTLASGALVDTSLALAQAGSPFVLTAAVLAAAPPIACWAYFARR
ncbi:hypothetical protein [Protaetiibacter intestinalis]|uniref:Uncharacterized protein n=1 Tax=Protaetiibacter intestinalis TaxID=2419774 RepID=A0A387B8S5_9MICO|nr:hypothetical protein [Protaetiibacter intestinalis]AYF97585.1 hypothetical protein D7I47_04450 [Protaetiibacter intestinalis]